MKLDTLHLLKELSILIVEDDTLARYAIKEELKPYCRTFYEAKDGIEGLEVFRRNQIDVIVTDVYMPELNGYDMMEEILLLKPEQAFIIMSSQNIELNIIHSSEEGAYTFLKKPLNIEDLQIALLMIKGRISYKIKKLSSQYSVDFQKETIYKNNNPIYLSYTCNKVFWMLCFNINHLVTYDMFENYLFEEEAINKNNFHSIILRIKKQLPNISIENIPNEGYILKV